MAGQTAPSQVSTLTPDNDDLTDGQIQELLARATQRLKSKEAPTQLAATDSPSYNIPKLDTGKLATPYVVTQGGVSVANGTRVLDERPHRSAIGIRKVDDPVAVNRFAAEQKKATAGGDWYDLPRTNLTAELKRDLQLIKMRGVLDPHRHYKKDNGKMKAPEYSQVGTIVAGPTEFFSGRIENKKRKRTFVEEVLAGEQETGRFKKKYNELQVKKTSGKKAFYKALKAKRKSSLAKARKG